MALSDARVRIVSAIAQRSNACTRGRDRIAARVPPKDASKTPFQQQTDLPPTTYRVDPSSLALGLDGDTIPSRTPYLAAPPAYRRKWRGSLGRWQRRRQRRIRDCPWVPLWDQLAAVVVCAACVFSQASKSFT